MIWRKMALNGRSPSGTLNERQEKCSMSSFSTSCLQCSNILLVKQLQCMLLENARHQYQYSRSGVGLNSRLLLLSPVQVDSESSPTSSGSKPHQP